MGVSSTGAHILDNRLDPVGCRSPSTSTTNGGRLLTRRVRDEVLLSVRETSGFLVGSAAVVGLLFGAFAIFDFQSNIYLGWISTVVGVALFCGVLSFASITVEVSEKQLRVVSSFFRFPLARVELDNVSTVTTELFSKTVWGGWGLRLRGRDRALVLSGTEATAITKRNGTKFYLAAQEADRITQALHEASSTSDAP